MSSDKSPFAHLAQRMRLNSHEAFDWFLKVFHKEEDERTRFLQSIFWHLKEILLCLLLACLLARVEQFQQFFSAFALDIKANNRTFLEFALIFTGNGFMIFWLSYVFWHKPASLFSNRITRLLFGVQPNRGFDLYYQHSGGMWRVAILAGIPLLLVDAALALSLLHENGLDGNMRVNTGLSAWLVNHSLCVIILVTIVFGLFTIVFRPRVPENASLKTRRSKLFANLLVFGGVIATLTLLFWCYPFYFRRNETLNYLVLLVLIFAPPLSVTFLLHSFSQCLIKEREPLLTAPTRPAGKMRFAAVYQTLRILSYCMGVLIFLLVNNKNITVQEWFSLAMFPVAMLLFVFVAYYQLLDLLFYNMAAHRLYFYFFLLILLTIGLGQHEHNQVKFNGQPAGSMMRASLEHYFLSWAADRFPADSLSTVYLVAAEGGGSRAGAWTAAVLTQLDSITGGRFQRQCFAISSVSGGSVGAAATLALWDNARMLNQPAALLYADSNRSKYIRRIFERNYISTALAGIFFYDAFQQIPILNWAYVSNYSRTDRHQDEESDAVRLGLSEVFPKTNQILPRYFKETNFLGLYYAHQRTDLVPQPKTALPLFFPNTCRVQDGRRGIASPVEMDTARLRRVSDNPFYAAVDIVGIARKTAPYRALSLGEVTSMSELFPFVNSNVYVDENTGSFMDGGAYENLGLTTLTEIHKALTGICANPDSAALLRLFPDTIQRKAFQIFIRQLRFKLILIYNVNNHGLEDYVRFENNSIQILDPITALLQTPFSGHTDYMYHRTWAELGPERVVDFPLTIASKNAASQNGAEQIVMSRWLSTYDVGVILRQARTCVSGNIQRLE